MKRIFFSLALMLCLSGCSQIELASHLGKQTILPTPQTQGTFKVGKPYKVDGQRYFPKENYTLTETGIASWYGKDFHGKKTANGETFDMHELTAAHRTLQMPSLVRVTNLDNGRSLIVRVNDRGPYKRSRVMDVSMRAAELLGFKNAGTAKIKLEVLKQESLQIAQAAKSGKSTKGYEMALNSGQHVPEGEQQPPVILASTPAQQDYQDYGAGVTAPAAVSSETLTASPVIPGHTRNGEFYPDPVVTEMPVTRTEIYVQAGSFTVPDNAYRLSASLQNLSRTEVFPAMVSGRQFYRVRVGPVATVAEADTLLTRVVSAGNSAAIIVVE